jgi:antitoxin CptB
MTGMTRSSEGLDERRKRLLYRAWHRGTREMDLIMGRFADAFIADLSDAELDAFERLTEQADPEMYNWISGEKPTPKEFDSDIFRRMRDFHAKGFDLDGHR